MDWTREQIDEIRAGRPMYGDSQKGGALVWFRTAQDTGGEYSLAYGVGKPHYTVFPHYHTGYTETLRVRAACTSSLTCTSNCFANLDKLVFRQKLLDIC